MRRHLARPALALLLSAVVGCSAPTTAGSPATSGPAGSPSSHTPTAPSFDPEASTVVIEVAAGHATEGGSQGTSRLRVYGDGSVERTAPDGIGTEQLMLDDGGVAALLAAADRLGMLSDPDLGDVMITDVGRTSLTIRLVDRTIDLEVIGPGIAGVGSTAVQRSRSNFSALLAQLWSLDGVGIAQQPRTVYPRMVVVVASLARASSADASWPLTVPARSAFATTSCSLVSGSDVRRLATMLAEQQRRGSAQGGGPVTVATGDVGVPALLLRISSDYPQCTPAPVKPTPLPELPWPADDRARSGQWDHWLAIGALDRAERRGELPGPDLGYYDLEYVSGSVDGVPVIDVVGTPDEEHAGREDVRGFVSRVDPSPATGPVVSRTAGA